MKAGPAKGSVLIVGTTALEAAAVLSVCYKKELREEFPSFFDGRRNCLAEEAAAAFASLKEAEEIAGREGVQGIFYPGEGGLFSSLWEMGETLSCGMEIDASAIPILQETVEICEYFDLNPYYALSGGMLLIASHDAYALSFRLRERGIRAVPAGILTEGPARTIRYYEHRRYLDRPQKEELRKLFPQPQSLPRWGMEDIP